MDILGITATSLIPVITVAGGSIVRSLFLRIDDLEKNQGMTEDKVRQLLDDKLELVKSNHEENRDAIRKLFEMYINLLNKENHDGTET